MTQNSCIFFANSRHMERYCFCVCVCVCVLSVDGFVSSYFLYFDWIQTWPQLESIAFVGIGYRMEGTTMGNLGC
jgi:hypothetical protein